MLLAAGMFMLLAAFLYVFALYKTNDTAYHLQQVQRGLDVELYKLEAVLDRAEEEFPNDSNRLFSNLLTESEYPIFLFKNSDLVFWSDYHYVPAYQSLNGDYKYRFINLPNSRYIVVKKTLVKQDESYDMFGVLPLAGDALIYNEAVQYNSAIFSSPAFELKSLVEEFVGMELKTPENNALLKINFLSGYFQGPDLIKFLAVLLAIIGIVLFIVDAFLTSQVLVNRGRSLHAILFLFFTLLLVRVLMLLLDFPYYIYPFQLFDPKLYASSSLNPSLGDFLLNTICFLLFAFVLYRVWKNNQTFLLLELKRFKSAYQMVVIALVAILLLVAEYFVFQTLVIHAQYSLDITDSIELTVYKAVAWMIFCLITLASFMLIHPVLWIARQINEHVQRRDFYYAGALLVFAAVLFYLLKIELLHVVVGVLLLYSLYVLVQKRSLVGSVSYQLFIYLSSVALISAFSAAIAMNEQHNRSIALEKERLANQLLLDNDIVGEFLLSEVSTNISHDPFIVNRFLSPFFNKGGVEKKIRGSHLRKYFDKYDTQVFLFNVDGSLVGGGNGFVNYYAMKERVEEKKAFKTDYPSLFLITESTSGGPTKRYQQYIPILLENLPVGYVVLDLTLKKYLPNTIYPELFFNNQFYIPENNRFDYAVFRNGKLEYNAGQFDYVHLFERDWLKSEKLFEEGIKAGGYLHNAIVGKGEKLVVVSNKSTTTYLVFSNFSFLFLLNIFLITICLMCYFIFYRLSIKQLSFSAKIQLYLNLSIFLPLIIVSIFTLSSISSTYSKEIESRYFNKAESISRNIADLLDERDVNPEQLEGLIAEIAKYAEADIHVFDTQGKLLATNQPIIYQKDYLSTFINPEALEAIKEKRHRQVILNEIINDLSYKSAYNAIRSYKNGSLLGILSIPFFESNYELQNQLTTIFSNTVNILAVLFILFLILLNFLSKELTAPLRYIAEKLKKTSLTGENEPLSWYTQDEIGMLVREYNHMLINLQESKQALSRTEKESAWREMAKQVAHEIKNPLTPMKLSLQHLNRMLKDQLQGAREEQFVDKSVKSLLSQIDTLSDIATSFSAFAKMPVPKYERFDIAGVLKAVVRLYENSEEAELISKIEEGLYYVVGDAQMMQRTFNNLILNGIQAVPVDRKPIIKVVLQELGEKKILIEISDNGVGIEEGIKDKVFVPNFSTKYSGSGLGLAIAKRGIEHAGGKIWFETETGVGTIFFIELLLAE